MHVCLSAHFQSEAPDYQPTVFIALTATHLVRHIPAQAAVTPAISRDAAEGKCRQGRQTKCVSSWHCIPIPYKFTAVPSVMHRAAVMVSWSDYNCPVIERCDTVTIEQIVCSHDDSCF